MINITDDLDVVFATWNISHLLYSILNLSMATVHSTKVNNHDSLRKVVNIAAKAFSVVAVHTKGVLDCSSA